jgi:hypothetical protein
VSALGHYIEEEGVATVAISLIRAQTERTKPPRALWVPFELGRPFGPPGNPGFQKRVIVSALRLLNATTGPVALEDFPDDDPRERPDPTWRSPIQKMDLRDKSVEGLASQFEVEVPQLAVAYARFHEIRGRTSVGLSGLSIAEASRYVGDYVKGRVTATPNPEMSPALTLRFAVDDLKAYYLEAALAAPSSPSSKQIADWFWNETAAGALILALRQANLASDDERLKLVANMFLVPGARVPPAS